MASYLTVVMLCIYGNGLCPMQMDDQKGYHTGPAHIALHKCYIRWSEIIAELTQKSPVTFARTLCLDVKGKPVKGKSKKLEKQVRYAPK